MFALFPCLRLIDDAGCVRWAFDLCRFDVLLRKFADCWANGSKAAIAFSIFRRSFFNSAKTCSIFKGPPELTAFLPRECRRETGNRIPVLFSEQEMFHFDLVIHCRKRSANRNSAQAFDSQRVVQITCSVGGQPRTPKRRSAGGKRKVRGLRESHQYR